MQDHRLYLLNWLSRALRGSALRASMAWTFAERYPTESVKPHVAELWRAAKRGANSRVVDSIWIRNEFMSSL